MSKEQRLRRHKRAERATPRSRSGGATSFKVRRGDFVQGKEKLLRFAGTAVKRYPTSKVRENNARFIK